MQRFAYHLLPQSFIVVLYSYIITKVRPTRQGSKSKKDKLPRGGRQWVKPTGINLTPRWLGPEVSYLPNYDVQKIPYISSSILYRHSFW